MNRHTTDPAASEYGDNARIGDGDSVLQSTTKIRTSDDQLPTGDIIPHGKIHHVSSSTKANADKNQLTLSSRRSPDLAGQIIYTVVKNSVPSSWKTEERHTTTKL